MGQKIKAKEIETSGLGLKPDLKNSLIEFKKFKDNYNNHLIEFIEFKDNYNNHLIEFIEFKDESNNNNSNPLVSTGTIFYRAVNSVPEGFLECNGAELSRNTYSELFNEIGTVFGTGDGSTTFNLPDLRGEFLRGFDNGRGVDTGRVFGSSQLDQMQKITGKVTLSASTEYGVTEGALNSEYFTNNFSADNNNDSYHITLDTSNSPNARTSDTTDGETRVRNVALLPLIKY
jgi:microcystin-dependent protein